MTPKLNVKLETLRPELAILEPLVDEVYDEFRLKAIVTSTKDAAFDLRVKVLSSAQHQEVLWRRLRNRIQEKHPGLYNVILKDAGGANAHIHVECSPKLAKMMFPEEGK